MSSASPIALSEDLIQLATEVEIEVRVGIGAFLLVHGIPYLDSNRNTLRGTLVTPLNVTLGSVTPGGGRHQAWWIGSHPCNLDGTEISAIRHSGKQHLGNELSVDHGFSNKVGGKDYADYRAKMTRYIQIISAPALDRDPTLTLTPRPITWRLEESPFIYTDTASSRSGFSAVSAKLRSYRIAVIGLGGTGSYLIDLLARTPVREIHLFDGDMLKQHNIFRAPGMVNYFDLLEPVSKVDYYARRYSALRRGIVPNCAYIDETNVSQLVGFDFVFIAIDKSKARKLIGEYLLQAGIPFIDCGMHVDLADDQVSLYGQVRTTLCTSEKHDHFAKKVPTGAEKDDDIYASNIQVAELNDLNASLAIYRWKVHCGFYAAPRSREHNLVFVTDSALLTQADYK